MSKRDDFDGAPSQWRLHLCWSERFSAVPTGCKGSKVVPYGQNPGLRASLTFAGSGRSAPIRQPALLPCCVVGGRFIEVCQHFRQTCLRQCLAAGRRDLDGAGPLDACDPGAIEQRLRQCGPQRAASSRWTGSEGQGDAHERIPATRRPLRGTARLLHRHARHDGRQRGAGADRWGPGCPERADAP